MPTVGVDWPLRRFVGRLRTCLILVPRRLILPGILLLLLLLLYLGVLGLVSRNYSRCRNALLAVLLSNIFVRLGRDLMHTMNSQEPLLKT